MRAQLDLYDQVHDINYVGHFEVTPGVIDYDAVVAYTEGHCASLAYCINRETSWDMALFTYKDEPRRYGHALHMGIIHPSGQILDIEGLTPRHEMRERWGANITKTTPDDYLRACELGLWIPWPEEEVTQTFVEPLLKEIA